MIPAYRPKILRWANMVEKTDTAQLAGAWRKEFVATAILCWPLALSQVATMGLGTVDTVLTGWLGPEYLAAASLANNVIFPLQYVGFGVLAAIAPMIAQDIGARKYKGVRRTVRQGLWVAITLTVVITTICLQGPEIMLFLGQDPEIVALSEDYLYTVIWSLFPSFGFVVFRNFIAAHSRPRVALVILVVGIGINFVADYVLMFGHFSFPRLELVGVGWATTVVQSFMFLSLLGYILLDRKFKRYMILVRFWRPDWPRFAETFRIGTPIGFMILAETALFAASTFMIGIFGADQLAGHSIALQCAGLAFMIPLGISQGASVRVGYAVGRRDPVGVEIAGWCSIIIGTAFATCTALLFWFFSSEIVELFLPAGNPEHKIAADFAVTFLTIAAVFQLVDSAQAVAAGALRGMKDTAIPTAIAVLGYWLIGAPVGYYLGFHTDLGGVGVWSGLVVGLAAVGLLLCWRFWRISRKGRLASAQ